MTVANEQELCRACRTLFGPDLLVNREFLEYLQWSGIKSAYRRRAFETHPDTLACADDAERQERSDLFIALKAAYEDLTAYLKARDNGYRLPQPVAHAGQPFRAPSMRPVQPRTDLKRNAFRSADVHRARSTNPPVGSGKEKLYSGPIPNRKLLFGHFLYYAGIVPFRSVIQALVWQRGQRPRLGEIGCRSGLLDRNDVLRILKSKNGYKPFGQSALDLGLLSGEELDGLICRQKRMQRRLGEFFVEKRILSPEQIRTLLVRHYLHNAGMMVRCGRD